LARLGPIALVFALLAGTAAAFGVTESLKTSSSPILKTKVSKTFSPVCRCATNVASIAFELRRRDRLTLAIEDASGHTVRVLFTSSKTPAGLHAYGWNGRRDDGSQAPDGVYRPRVELEDADRVIVLPNRIQLDTTPPVVTVVGKPRLTAGGPIVVRYRVNEEARGILAVGGKRVARTYRVRLDTTLRIPLSTLRSVGALRGAVTLAAEDLAGNVSRPRVIGVRG
jgi:hypothetical protein